MYKGPFVRSAHNFDMDEHAKMHATDTCNSVDLTIQSGKEDCDINVIMRRFGITGQMPVNVRAPIAGDFTGVMDFHSAMNAIVAAEDSFMQMPAELRAELNHDPARFVDFCGDERNRERLKKYGLLLPGEPPVVPPVVPPPAS